MKQLYKKISNIKRTKTNIFLIELFIFLMILIITNYLKNNILTMVVMILTFVVITVSQAIALNIIMFHIKKIYSRDIVIKNLNNYIKKINYSLKKGFSKDIFRDYLKFTEVYKSYDYITGVYNKNKFELATIKITRQRSVFTYDFDSPYNSYNTIDIFIGDWYIFKLNNKNVENVLIVEKNSKFFNRFSRKMAKVTTNNKLFDNIFNVYTNTNNLEKKNDKIYMKILNIKEMLNKNLGADSVMFFINNNELHIGIESGIEILEITSLLGYKEENSMINAINNNLNLFNKFIKEVNEIVDLINS